ncbi:MULTISPECIES: type II toxin-antitoxin system CcdA family antitoxin [unclassified Rhizobium]|uniref:type II toxin-antitoxin system CcdA family antitoxin n=1 Tax=Rhizobium sp. Rhizsp82 TaxID=3243057 RepID=UPI0039B38DB6
MATDKQHPETDEVPIASRATSDDATLPREERRRLWLIENAEAIAEENAYVEKHGLPLARYRTF